METIEALLIQFFRYSFLFFIISLAATFWFLQVIFLRIARSARHSAMGATPIIKGWARLYAKLFGWLRKPLGRYVKKHHPKAYKILYTIFQ